MLTFRCRAILMILGSLVVIWGQTDSTTGIVDFFNRILELIRLGLFFGGVGWIVYNIVAWRTAEYSVTNLRVLGREGLIRRRSTDTLLTSVSDIRSMTPALCRMLGYGNVRIVSAAGEAGKLPPLRLLLVMDNLAGHLTAHLVVWLFEHARSPL